MRAPAAEALHAHQMHKVAEYHDHTQGGKMCSPLVMHAPAAEALQVPQKQHKVAAS